MDILLRGKHTMKIVHVEDGFNGDTGYQLPLLAKFMSKAGHQVTIVTSEMKKNPKHLTSFFKSESVEEADARYTAQTGVKNTTPINCEVK